MPAVDLTSADDQRPGPAVEPPPATRRALLVARSVQARVKADNATLLAAGVAFFGLLAIFPAMIAVISIYGLVADPDVARDQVAELARTLPDQTQELITQQLDGIATSSATGLSFAAVIALGAALWTTSSGVSHLLEAVRAAYGVPKASFVQGRLRALGYALAGALVAVVVLVLLALVPTLAREYLPSPVETLVVWARWPFLAVVMVLVLAQVYRHGSSARGGWARWISPGGLLAVAAWLLASVGFAVYVSLFGSFDATYGSLGAVIVTMLWLYLSSLCIVVGAYVNAELERRDEVDSMADEA